MFKIKDESYKPQAIPLAMITMRISIHGFPFLSHMGMALHLVVAARAIYLCFKLSILP